MGILATGWFGIPLAPRYLALHQVDTEAEIFTLFSALGTIWGVMAYRELTRSADLIVNVRALARDLDPQIGAYDYRSYNPETKEYENGYLPLGPIDFWDKETQVPAWLDKGKYWHILLGLQTGTKEIILQVVRDSDLPFSVDRRNVAVTYKEMISLYGSQRKTHKRFRYRVKIPQWIVMNTERTRLINLNGHQFEDENIATLIAELNRKLVLASEEIIEREKPRIKYPGNFMTLVIYLNKSLPIRLVYHEAIRHLPGAKKRIIAFTNENLANTKDNDLISALVLAAEQRGISVDKIAKIRMLLRFLQNSYTSQGIGEGSSEYHNFHHTLEVSYLSLQMLPREFHNYRFNSADYELLLIAGLLHDYDPGQLEANRSPAAGPKGPNVVRTISELQETGIHVAYFTMGKYEFENYFRDYKSALLPPIEFATTHPEYIKPEDNNKIESGNVEALIWRTDFPYFKHALAQKKFVEHLNNLDKMGLDSFKIKLIGEVLWLADLSVTYMGSDPIRAWDRVTNLYEELYLPKFEAVSRTDEFFSDFAETELFKELIKTRQFPDIFRQRWNLIFQFFHEGNPSTQLNRTINKARKLYLKVNIEVDMRRGDILEEIAVNNWAEYFIGIGKDQTEVSRAKLRFADLDPPNASSFWGDTKKLIPSISNRSVDNFFLVLPKKHFSNGMNDNPELTSLISHMPSKLRTNGSLQILTDAEGSSSYFNDLELIGMKSGFHLNSGRRHKEYFPKNIRESYFAPDSTVHTLVFDLNDSNQIRSKTTVVE
jgi:HD superfamily phosphodiesterase/tRNA G46 methylase TrmB